MLGILFVYGCTHINSSSLENNNVTCAASSIQQTDKQTSMQLAIRLDREAEQYYQSAEPEEAAICYERALSIRTKTLGSFHFSLLNNLFALANAYEATEEYGKASTQYRRALQVLQRSQPNPKKEGEILGYIGAIRFRTTTYDNLEELEHSLNLYHRFYGTQHINIAVTHHLLAKHYFLENEFRKAEQFVTQALVSTKQIAGSKHPYIAIIQYDYANILSKTGREQQAIMLEKDSEEILSSHPEKKLSKIYYP